MKGLSDEKLTLVMLAIIATVLFCLGGAAGWCMRSVTTYDIYVRTLAEKHEADRKYWSMRAAQIVEENERERAKRHVKP